MTAAQSIPSKNNWKTNNHRKLKLFVRNIAWEVTESELSSYFEQIGDVKSCKIITDRETGRSRGFGFVEMPDKDAAARAIRELTGKQIRTREIVVAEAVERER